MVFLNVEIITGSCFGIALYASQMVVVNDYDKYPVNSMQTGGQPHSELGQAPCYVPIFALVEIMTT